MGRGGLIRGRAAGRVTGRGGAGRDGFVDGWDNTSDFCIGKRDSSFGEWDGPVDGLGSCNNK